MVGDAFMAPYELGQSGPWSATDSSRVPGIQWLQILADHFRDSCWLNPEPLGRWNGSTIEDIARVFEMFPLTTEGLTEAMAWGTQRRSTAGDAAALRFLFGRLYGDGEGIGWEETRPTPLIIRSVRRPSTRTASDAEMT